MDRISYIRKDISTEVFFAYISESQNTVTMYVSIKMLSLLIENNEDHFRSQDMVTKVLSFVKIALDMKTDKTTHVSIETCIF